MMKELIKKNKIAIKIYNILNNKLKYINLLKVEKEYKKSQHATLTINQAKNYNKYRINGPQKLLCNAPFTSLFINMNGNVNVCGYNKTYVLGNILEDNIKNIWNGKKHNILKDSIRDFDLSKGCHVCQQKIETEDYHRAAIYFDTPKADKQFNLKKITFELSNLCNLECVMCNGELSSLIRKNRENRSPLFVNNFNNLAEQLKDFIPHLEFVQFLGGEPLLIKTYYKIWDEIVALNPNCTISVQTNCSVMPEKFIKLLNSSSQFIISVSIDSFNKLNYEKIREKADFDVFIKNFKVLYRYKQNNKIKLSINFVPMTINWKEIPDALSFANKHEIMLSMSELDSPYEFSFFSMSSTQLLEIIDFLEDRKPKVENNIYEVVNLRKYNNQIIQLKHVLQLVEKSEKIYKKKLIEETLTDVMLDFNNTVKKLPIYNYRIEDYLKVNFTDKLIEFSEIDKFQLYNEFNRYCFLRSGLFEQNKYEYIESENFEGLIISELKSVIKVIFNLAEKN